MAIKKKGATDNFIRGSDTLWHSIQMFFAGIMRMLIIGTVSSVLAFAAIVGTFTNEYEREIVGTNYLASLLYWIGWNKNVTLNTIKGPIVLSAKDAARLTKPAADKFFIFLTFSAFISLCVGGAVVVLLGGYQIKRGKKEADDNFLRGQKLVSEKELNKLTSKNETDGGFKIGSVSIPDALLARNLAFVGSMGTGKSQGIFNFADTARQSKKAIVYDVTGEFVERYYDRKRSPPSDQMPQTAS